MVLMLLYGVEHLQIDIYEAKIKEDNFASIKMFKKMGFVQESETANVFGEVELKSPKDTREFVKSLKSHFSQYSVEKYNR